MRQQKLEQNAERSALLVVLNDFFAPVNDDRGTAMVMLLSRYLLGVKNLHRREVTRRRLEEGAAKVQFLRSEKERLKTTRGKLSLET